MSSSTSVVETDRIAITTGWPWGECGKLAMSNYVPWYGKKRAQRARREEDLLRLLRRGGDATKLIRAAEQVRDARIRVLKADRSQILWCDGAEQTRLAEIESAISLCLSTPIDTIIAEFRARLRS